MAFSACTVTSKEIEDNTEFQLLISLYRDNFWDGEIDSDLFYSKNEIIWDLFEKAKTPAISGISINTLAASGFSEEGIYKIFILYQSCLLANQHILGVLIANSSIQVAQKIIRQSY
jgi:hypothetical protein